jgi:hypothetical protein
MPAPPIQPSDAPNHRQQSSVVGTRSNGTRPQHAPSSPAGATALCPPVPRGNRLDISPQPTPLGLRLRFHVGVLLATIWWQLLGVAPEEPGQAWPDLLWAITSAAHQDAADLAPVLVDLAALGRGLPFGQQARPAAAAIPAERLP